MSAGLQMKYFVLKPRGAFADPYAKASRAAIKAYADAINAEDSALCHDLHMWVIEEQGTANKEHLLAKLEADDESDTKT